jgi:hypothetical protein
MSGPIFGLWHYLNMQPQVKQAIIQSTIQPIILGFFLILVALLNAWLN